MPQKIIKKFKIILTHLLKTKIGIPLIEIYLEVILLVITTKKNLIGKLYSANL